MLDGYEAFLAAKAPRPIACGIEPMPIDAPLKDFQKHCAEFCIRQGRAALFLDTGLGKTICQLEFCKQAIAETGQPALILTPLAVARQIEREARRFGYNATVIRSQSDVRRDAINICNYDRLDKLDASAFGAVSLDESSILKSFTGATTRSLIEAFSATRFRLCATATPAPNDHMELGQHAEFLGIMASNEMLARWFISDQTQMGRYRLKRHGESDFWDWMASWARMAETPADLGFDGSEYVLPDLRVIRHQVAGDYRAPAGSLFVEDVSATNMFAIKRDTTAARALEVARLVHDEPDHAWVIWCDTDFESEALARAIPEAVEVRGSMPVERKESALGDFAEGRAKVIVTKATIAGFGVNWQHADRQAFVGRSFSYEAWYQAVRRSWRFGQRNPVHVHLAVAEGEDQIGRVIDRKAEGHAAMKRAMAEAMRRDRARSSEVKAAYNPTFRGSVPQWLKTSN